MRTVTVVVLAAVVVVLAGAAVVGFGFAGGGGVTLDERWVSDTEQDILGNHHAPGAGRVNGTGMVFAPVSGRGNTPNCALYGLYGTNGSTKWRDQIPAANCTIHSVADPVLADYDGDGTREVVAATTEQAVVAHDPLTGEEELRVNLTDYGYTQPVVADLTNDGAEEIVVVDVSGSVFVIQPNGTVAWMTRLQSSTWGQPAVADFDGDGKNELVVGTGDGTLTAFEGNGTVAWKQQNRFDGSITWMTTGQADDEPGTEIAVATVEGTVAMVDGDQGAIRWEKDFGDLAAVHAFGDGDGDGDSEIYAVAKDATLRSLDAKSGEIEWTTTLTTADVQMTPPPTLGNVDEDAEMELVTVTNDGIVAVIDPKDGDILDTYKREVAIYAQPTVVDTDGDGIEEIYVMYGDGRVVSLSLANR